VERKPHGRAIPGRLRRYIAASIIAGMGAVALAILVDPEIDWKIAVLFGSLAFAAEQFPITVPIGSTYSVTFILTIAAIIIAGPAEATIAAVFAAISVRDVREKPLHRNLFNAAQLAFMASATAVVYQTLGGSIGESIRAIDASDLLRGVIAPLAVAVTLSFMVNTAMVSAAVAMSQNMPFGRIWRSGYAAVWRTYVAFALLGVMLGVLYLQAGPGVVIFLLMPLLVARHAFQAAVAMENAYDSTVRSLISAIEAKDPYTSGHAGRVSELSEMVARAYGLSPQVQRKIRYAALMHDVGKLVVLNKVLQKPGKLTPEEYEHMKAHPVHGVEIVSEIELLSDALVGVRHHHERMDGKGYPDGLIGDEIPFLARLIMVCDAFDSMTSTRSYRKAKNIEDAFAELHRCVGTQFDPAAIEALERAVAKEGWEPHPETEALFAVPVPEVHERRHHGDDHAASL